MSRRFVSLLAGAGLATGISDGLFATVLSVFFYHSTFTRLWQGVAAVLIGKGSFAGGTRTTALGLLMHFGVAFFWSSVLLFFATRSPRLRDRLRSAMGRLTVAAVYGPVIWIVMSMIVIPLLLRRPPAITSRWWVQGIGHIPFVALPMATVIGYGLAERARSAVDRSAVSVDA
jgi:hypothetical protein